MSDYQDQDLRSPESFVPSKLYICLFAPQQQFAQSVIKLLKSDRYELKCLNLTQDFINFIVEHKEQIDCLVFVKDTQNSSVLTELWQAKILLPILIIEVEATEIIAEPQVNSAESLTDITPTRTLYHQAEIYLYPTQLGEINSYINLAISKFLSFAPDFHLSNYQTQSEPEVEGIYNSLLLQQRKLTEKLKARLGYLGVYYKRNPSDFYRNLPSAKQKELYQQLNQSYRQILIIYFTDSSQINKLIDEFVDQVFFTDISTSQILEIHMELIDQFSQQLQIEGRSDDILLDYRLPLIDIIAHLCEMYRRSIPGEDISWELLYCCLE
jgi:circadian clock protein KaiA